jgi:hypothetical protein
MRRRALLAVERGGGGKAARREGHNTGCSSVDIGLAVLASETVAAPFVPAAALSPINGGLARHAKVVVGGVAGATASACREQRVRIGVIAGQPHKGTAATAAWLGARDTTRRKKCEHTLRAAQRTARVG